MKISIKGIFALVIFTFLSCSKDDAVEAVTLSEPEFDIILVGEDAERVYQFDYNTVNNIEEQSDLTQELGLGSSYLTLRQEGDLLSFYIFSSGNFSLIQKNVATGASSLEANFYLDSNERSILWGTNDIKNIYLGFFSPQGTSNFGVLTIDIESGSQAELIIEDGIQKSYQPIYNQGRLLLTYRDSSDNYKVAVLDTATNTIMKRLEFGPLVPNIFINDMGDVVILKSNEGEDYSYAIYDADTFESTTEVIFSLTRYFEPGNLTARLVEQKLFYYSFYTQPAEVLFRPASFDFSTNTETLVDMEGIVNQIERNGKNIQLISQGIDEKSSSYLVGYANLNDSSKLDGGMLIISFEGELIKNVELPFVPTYFLLKE
jgi:hypothetical protein